MLGLQALDKTGYNKDITLKKCLDKIAKSYNQLGTCEYDELSSEQTAVLTGAGNPISLLVPDVLPLENAYTYLMYDMLHAKNNKETRQETTYTPIKDTEIGVDYEFYFDRRSMSFRDKDNEKLYFGDFVYFRPSKDTNNSFICNYTQKVWEDGGDYYAYVGSPGSQIEQQKIMGDSTNIATLTGNKNKPDIFIHQLIPFKTFIPNSDGEYEVDYTKFGKPFTLTDTFGLYIMKTFYFIQ